MSKVFFWATLAVAIVAAAWFLVPLLLDRGATGIQISAMNPWLIGGEDDAFSYTGEEAILIKGEASIWINLAAEKGVVEFDLQPDANLMSRLGREGAERPVVLRSQIQDADALWTDVTIHKGHEVGDARMPVTHAIYAGSGKIELIIDGLEDPTTWTAFWSIGDALRQDDGSIRNQGLIFSPLLRDPSIFSDPQRRELTLLVYESSDSDVVVLHLVFPDVQIAGI